MVGICSQINYELNGGYLAKDRVQLLKIGGIAKYVSISVSSRTTSTPISSNESERRSVNIFPIVTLEPVISNLSFAIKPLASVSEKKRAQVFCLMPAIHRQHNKNRA
jgi:hypothetical protein